MNKPLISILLVLCLVTPGWGGVTFDGNNDGISIGDLPNFNNNLSIAAWIRVHTVTDDYAILSQYTGTNASSSFIFRIDTSARPSFVSNSGTTVNLHTCVETVTLNQWTHVAMATDGTTTDGNTEIYINGVECTYGSTQQANTQDAATPIMIGRRQDATDEADGDMLEITAWSTYLTAAQVALLAQNKVMRFPLQIAPGSILIDYPLDECSDGVECGSFKDIAMGNTAQGMFGTLGLANPLTTYP